jgi:hypothetical protein
MKIFTWFALVALTLPGLCQAAVQARVYELQKPQGTAPLYVYTMERNREGSVESWNAKITDDAGKQYALENTVFLNGKLARYTFFQTQVGEEGEVRVIPKGVLFRYFKDGKWREDWEETSQEVITGPQVVDTLLRHWDTVMAGKDYEVRYAVPDRLETFGFRFKVEKKDSDTTVVHFVPTSFFVRQMVDPVIITLETTSKKLKSIAGPTLLKIKKGDSWEELKADIRF